MAKKSVPIIRWEALWALKHLSGYTTREIASKTGIAEPTLHNAFKGTYPLSDEAVRKLAKFFNVLAERLVDIPTKRA